MNAMRGTVLGLAMAMGGWACFAQEASVPSGQLERDSQLSRSLAVSGEETASISSSRTIIPGVGPLEPAAASFVRVPPVMSRPSLGSKFFMLNAMHLGMAVFDVEMTQRCIVANTCREANPLMPASLAGKLGVDFAFVGYGSFVSYRMKKHGMHMWWLSPTVGVAAHSVGAASGLVH